MTSTKKWDRKDIVFFVIIWLVILIIAMGEPTIAGKLVLLYGSAEIAAIAVNKVIK